MPVFRTINNYFKGILAQGLMRFMSRENQIVYMVLNCSSKKVTPNVIFPATDYVMHTIKKHFKKIKPFGKIYRGEHNGSTVALVSSGIGAPAVAMTVEALRCAGVKNIIRVDYCGSLAEYPEIGDIVICSEAICGDGTTPHYLNSEIAYPRVPGDSVLISRIKEEFESTKIEFYCGPIWTHDALFREPQELIEKAVSNGAIALDMETSVLFALGQLYNISTASILIVTDRPRGEEFLSEKIKISPRILQNLDTSIDIALNILSSIEG